ncbi:hypothetical protein PGB34_18785 [Xenophilus arseniciresistens]|uniref:X-Tfes XVIPCD domain-containing protein n=1 Tax=Xenophilus arseniciresistens TaxID=1283306 RepID=A0AAE3N9Z5_9BURK|nr:XVIPCD domain-containing protein [Xenophilus arseniciresistens]MDA7418420.1 hypothetical protein [Xenophilus arseniciresistens]
MSSITSKEALAVLKGSEGAADNKIAPLAVPNSVLGKPGHGYASGFAFGQVQLDIGNNSEAKAAYREILALGVTDKVITQAQADDLAKYAVKRPDVAFPDSYREARKTLNETVFNPQGPIAAKVDAIIEKHQQNHLAIGVVPQVNEFLKKHHSGVFDPKSPDYATAVASVVSAANRSGNLVAYSNALQTHAAPTLAHAKSAWSLQIGDGIQPGDWSLVERGAQSLRAQGASLSAERLQASPLFKDALVHLQTFNNAHGIATDHRTTQAAGAIAAAAAIKGLSRIDQLEPSEDGSKLVALQGKPGSVHSKVAYTSTLQALDTSLASSAKAFEQAQEPLQKHDGPTLAHAITPQLAPTH